jgi:hypothetical protein
MDFLLLIILLLAFIFTALSWIIWKTYSSGSLREMNAGARLYQEKRYTEAEHHFQQLLTKRLPPGVEADTRRRLADTRMFSVRAKKPFKRGNKLRPSLLSILATPNHSKREATY